MVLTQAKIGETVRVVKIDGQDKVKRFLGSLGCTEGSEVTLISILAGNYVINIKDSRYAIDRKTAQAIVLDE